MISMFVMMVLVTILVILVTFLYLYIKYFNQPRLDLLKGRHVLVTGGSKGMGFELARIAVQNGAHVTILARDKEHLERSKLELIKCAPETNQKILAFSVDISETKLFNLERAITEAEDQSGPVYLLACCAGFAIARTFAETSLDDFHRLMNVNYFGMVNAIKATLPSLKKNRDGAKILMYSSIGGVFGLYGYSAYSGSKFAVVGLAQVLQMELKPENISVTVAFPPDTDTPGYEIEQVGKPKITQIISEEGGLFSAYDVSLQALKDCLRDEFISTTGLNGFFILIITAGIMPTKSWIKRIFQVCLMSPLRIFALHFLHTCDNIVKRHSTPTVPLDRRSKSRTD